MSVKFEDYRVQVKEALGNAATSFLHEAAGELVTATARNSRVRTGQTKGSYEYKVVKSNDEPTAYIGSDLENAIWEEYGTGEYALHGDGRKGGWVYEDAYGKKHFTRGKAPNRPLFNAFASLRSKIIRMAEEKLKGLGR